MILAESKYIWDTETWKEHIESVCSVLGYYIGNKYIIKKQCIETYEWGKKAGYLKAMFGPWIIKSSSESPFPVAWRFSNLEEAIEFFCCKDKFLELA